jgi:hypothetical protein
MRLVSENVKNILHSLVPKCLVLEKQIPQSYRDRYFATGHTILVGKQSDAVISELSQLPQAGRIKHSFVTIRNDPTVVLFYLLVI